MSGSNEADAVHGMRPEDGRTDNMLQVAPTKAPIIIVAGRSMRWVSVLIIMRAMCGTASPIKDIGPQKAVAAAVSRPVARSRRLRVRLMFMPRLRA